MSVAIIKENADKMAQLVDTLMEKTHLNKQEIQEVLNDVEETGEVVDHPNR